MKKIAVGLGWDVNEKPGESFDLDAFAVVLSNGKKMSPDHVCYFNQKNILGGAVVHQGDNLTGAGAGDDETMVVELSKLPADSSEVMLCVNIYQATERRQNFGRVENAFIRLYDFDTKAVICKFDLTEDYSAFTGMIMAKVYLKDGEWRCQAIGEGRSGSIPEIAKQWA